MIAKHKLGYDAKASTLSSMHARVYCKLEPQKYPNLGVGLV